MSEAALEFDGVCLSYGAVEALRGVSFRAPAGAVVGLVGPDGAGKTSLVRLAAGLLRPQAGTVRVMGLQVPRQVGQLRSMLGYLPQRLGLHGHLTARENMEYFAALNSVPPRAQGKRISELLAATGLDAFANRLAERLSGGMRQKLALACAIVHKPRLVLLDEPSTGLDPIFRRDMWELIYGLVAGGASAVVATPSWEEAARCQWIAVLDQGRLLCAGQPEAITRQASGRVWQTPATQQASAALRAMGDAVRVSRRGRWLRIVVAGQQPEDVVKQLAAAVPGIELVPDVPSLEDAVALLRTGSHARP